MEMELDVMDTDKKIISFNQQKKYEELTNLVEKTSTEEVRIKLKTFMVHETNVLIEPTNISQLSVIC